jgi:hypothetical protein
MTSQTSLKMLFILTAMSISIPARAVIYMVTLLHPTGASSTIAYGVSAASQVGTDCVFPCGLAGRRALLWSSSAASSVDLTPPGMTSSEARGVSGNQQVGFGGADVDHALLWSGTAASVVDLHPAGYSRS